jgi:hypothetical protein
MRQAMLGTVHIVAVIAGAMTVFLGSDITA